MYSDMRGIRKREVMWSVRQSVLVINTLNSIERFTSDKISLVSDEETGMIEFRFIRKPSHDAKLLFKSMVLGLQEIEEDSEYEPYIDIIFKEV